MASALILLVVLAVALPVLLALSARGMIDTAAKSDADLAKIHAIEADKTLTEEQRRARFEHAFEEPSIPARITARVASSSQATEVPLAHVGKPYLFRPNRARAEVLAASGGGFVIGAILLLALTRASVGKQGGPALLNLNISATIAVVVALLMGLPIVTGLWTWLNRNRSLCLDAQGLTSHSMLRLRRLPYSSIGRFASRPHTGFRSDQRRRYRLYDADGAPFFSWDWPDPPSQAGEEVLTTLLLRLRLATGHLISLEDEPS